MKQNRKQRLNAANFLPLQTTTPDASSRSDRTGSLSLTVTASGVELWILAGIYVSEKLNYSY